MFYVNVPDGVSSEGRIVRYVFYVTMSYQRCPIGVGDGDLRGGGGYALARLGICRYFSNND